jgi:hypothetical protein
MDYDRRQLLELMETLDPNTRNRIKGGMRLRIRRRRQAEREERGVKSPRGSEQLRARARLRRERLYAQWPIMKPLVRMMPFLLSPSYWNLPEPVGTYQTVSVLGGIAIGVSVSILAGLTDSVVLFLAVHAVFATWIAHWMVTYPTVAEMH